MFKKVLTVLLVSLFSLNSSYVFAEEITQEAQGGQIPQITICHANEGNGYVVLTVPAIVAEGEGNDGHASHEGDIIPITDQNGDEILTEEDCLIVAGDEQVNEEPVDTILSCEDVFDTEDLLVYLAEFDGDPDCIPHPVVDYNHHYNIFPGDVLEEVIFISVDGNSKSIASLPNFTMNFLDLDLGILQGKLTFPYNFPNWSDDELPVVEESVVIALTNHTSCDTITTPISVFLEYLTRFNGNSILCGDQTTDEVPVEEVVPVVEEESNGGGGGSSSGSRRPSNQNGGGLVLGAFDQTGEVLGDTTTSCPVFSGFYRKGDTGEGVKSIQTFLNEHMNAGLVVDGMFGLATEKAVHAFQQKYWDQTIKPWTSVFSSRTTGRWYKTTSAWANTLSGCVSEPVFLEDTGEMYTPATI